MAALLVLMGDTSLRYRSIQVLTLHNIGNALLKRCHDPDMKYVAMPCEQYLRSTSNNHDLTKCSSKLDRLVQCLLIGFLVKRPYDTFIGILHDRWLWKRILHRLQ